MSRNDQPARLDRNGTNWTTRNRGKLMVAGLALLGGFWWRRRRRMSRIDVGRVSESWLAEQEFEAGRDTRL